MIRIGAGESRRGSGFAAFGLPVVPALDCALVSDTIEALQRRIDSAALLVR